MPYFDHVDYLLEAALSVAKLDYPQLELLVVDDCAPVKRARDVLSNCNIENLRFVEHEKNLGHVAAKNTGIRNSHGEFILPLDSDDLLCENYLQETIAPFKDEKVGIVITDVSMFGEMSYKYTPAMTKQDLVNQRTPSNTFVARRSLFSRVGYYDETLSFGDETDFLLRVLEDGWKIEHVAQPLYLYRKHENGLSRQVSYIKMLEDLIDRHPETFKEFVKEALLYREKRYWSQSDADSSLTAEAQSPCHSDVGWRQYAYLHTEFHKLLKHYEDSQAEVARLSKELEGLANNRYFRLRGAITKGLSAFKKRNSSGKT